MTHDRILLAEWAAPFYPADPSAVPGPCPVCGDPRATCVHDPATMEAQAMAGAAKKTAAKKTAAAPKDEEKVTTAGPSGVPVEAAPGDDGADGGQDGDALQVSGGDAAGLQADGSDADGLQVDGSGDGADDDAAAAADADDATEADVQVNPEGGPGVSNLRLTSPEVEGDDEGDVTVGEGGIESGWYVAVNDNLVQFTRTVVEEFVHEGAKRISTRQVFVRGQVVPKSVVETYNARV